MRRDMLTWIVAVAVGAVGTALADLAGARLGAALTLGTALVLVIVLGDLALEARRD